ncbi:ATP-dependent carboxylate-amine ligase [Natronosalvus halobius]|uniref:ATP-binding protein n=1 Tax=Natronosalvus halobius TaxID=2953746 RepID=UPI0020A1AA45|nr:ATP-dependent carboxylate-amine ligase [Natronosalvus halobius]USZ72081.1 ATP-dependent carboxylate-amine ligase [Natronosalvus halobius]
MSADPTVLLLDGDYPTALTVAKELSEDLGATIVGVGTTRYSRLLRSRYCDEKILAPPPESERYGDAVESAVRTYRPDFVLPVGYQSTVAVDRLRSILPSSVSTSLPSSESLHAGADKSVVLDRAARLGIDVPEEYSSVVEQIDANGRPRGALERLNFPVFLKARHESGGGETTARVDDPARFWRTYDHIAAVAPGGDVLVQELIEGTRSTYGIGVLCSDNDVVLRFGHEELRSVPRWGGSGTHLRTYRNPSLETQATALLQDIGWNGIALVEFKRRSDGSFVLMEVNPKFWASYALASERGYRFASTMVASALGLNVDIPVRTLETVDEMVFPLRELQYCVRQPTRSEISAAARTVLTPGAKWSLDWTDPIAWLMPPVAAMERVTDVETRLEAAVETVTGRRSRNVREDRR